MEGIRVGLFELSFYGDDQAYPLTPPPWHAGFEFQSKTEVSKASVFSHSLQLHLENKNIHRNESWDFLICRNEIWELWTDQNGDYIFTNPMQSLHRQLVIDRQFTDGEVYGNFQDSTKPNYPLPQDLEIVFFVNWLGQFNDMILHASGMVHEGRGYAFAGRSGVGKSTLISSLAQETGVTVLGEDQVILRKLGDDFWLFGTPWHENRNLCSHIGAPLEKIYFLEQQDSQSVEEVTPTDGVARLLQTAFIPYYHPKLVDRLLERLALLSEQIPLRQLSYNLGTNVLEMITG